MCRHLARLGPPATLAQTLLERPHGLLQQSWAPRRQRHGTVNVDGFGVGWYPPGAPPVRYRRDVPLWTDRSFSSLAGSVRTTVVLAAVRSATAGGPGGEDACAPFLLPGGVLLSHNGVASVAALAPLVGSAELAAVGSTVDSAFVAALVARHLGAGADLPTALADTVLAVAAADPGARLNLLATDGVTIAATTWGDTLVHRTGGDGAVVVASEPDDDDPGWVEVAQRCLVVVSGVGVDVRPLSPPRVPEGPR